MGPDRVREGSRPMPSRPDVDSSGPEPHIFIVLILLLVFFLFATMYLPEWAGNLVWLEFLLSGLIVVRYAFGRVPRLALHIVIVIAAFLIASSVISYLGLSILHQVAALAVAIVVIFAIIIARRGRRRDKVPVRAG